jgi:hypothetical protein
MIIMIIMIIIIIIISSSIIIIIIITISSSSSSTVGKGLTLGPCTTRPGRSSPGVATRGDPEARAWRWISAKLQTASSPQLACKAGAAVQDGLETWTQPEGLAKRQTEVIHTARMPTPRAAEPNKNVIFITLILTIIIIIIIIILTITITIIIIIIITIIIMVIIITMVFMCLVRCPRALTSSPRVGSIRALGLPEAWQLLLCLVVEAGLQAWAEPEGVAKVQTRLSTEVL